METDIFKKKHCRSCADFHKGIMVDHSHCVSSKGGFSKGYMLKKNGYISACRFWEHK